MANRHDDTDGEIAVMPVQKSRKTPSTRGMRRSHDGLGSPRCRWTRLRVKHIRVIAFRRTVFTAARKSSRAATSQIRNNLRRLPLRSGMTLSSNPLAASRPFTIAVDAMGGDHGPSVTVPASLDALAHEPACTSCWSGWRFDQAAAQGRATSLRGSHLGARSVAGRHDG